MKKEPIEIYEKNVFGRTMMYVQNPETAKTIAVLTGKLTLDDKDIDALKKLGFAVTITRLPGSKR